MRVRDAMTVPAAEVPALRHSRLGLEPLSFLPAEFLARSPTESPVGRSCYHAAAPGTSRVKGTHAFA